jgi:PAS domain S-box-containing protein
MTDKSDFIPSELLYEAIVDSSDDAIISKNLQSIVVSWNKSAERIFGYSSEEMVGQSIAKLFPADRLDEEAQILARLEQGERVDHFETQRQRKDGKLIDVSLTISPICNAEGAIVGASKIARDITERREAHRKLAQALEELKNADRMKAEFLATLSHELRTPLNAILGWVQILREEESVENFIHAIPIIERNVRIQSQLIEDLLDMSRIETGKVSLDIRRVELPTVVGAAIETVRPAARAKEIRLTSAFASMTGIVMGDKDRLQQIVWNLLTNAIKFTPKEGRVHVMIKRVNSHVEIGVTDSGRGISEEFLGQVFDRFRQADGGTTRRFGGLGLGLSIVKHLTELHGGNVRVASDGLEKGATFIISLPLQAVRSEPEELIDDERHASFDAATKKPDLTGIRVLMVDDEGDSIEIVRRILERKGAEVRTARSMVKALEEFTPFMPQVLITDIGMPEHDGFELLARLRELPGGRSVPAVALTAMARNEDRIRALRAGFHLHLVKPVDFNELVAVVQNLAALQTD